MQKNMTNGNYANWATNLNTEGEAEHHCYKMEIFNTLKPTITHLENVTLKVRPSFFQVKHPDVCLFKTV